MNTVSSISSSDIFHNEVKKMVPCGFEVKPLNIPLELTVCDIRSQLAIVDSDILSQSGPESITDFCRQLKKASLLQIIFCGKSSTLPLLENMLVPGSIGFVERPFSKPLFHQQIMIMQAFDSAGLFFEVKESAGMNISVSNLINSFTFDFWAMDKGLKYVFQNRHSRNRWGNVIGKGIEDLEIGQALQSVWKEQALKSLNGKVVRSMYTAGEINGKHYFESTISPITIDGEIFGIMGITQDISRFKKAEQALSAQKAEISDTNTALKVLLKKRDTDKINIENKVINNLHAIVLPLLDELTEEVSHTGKILLDEIKTALADVCSSFSRDLKLMQLTGTQIQVASHIRSGKTTKEIADIMGVAPSTVNTHRAQIRKKAGIQNGKIGLKTFLSSLS